MKLIKALIITWSFAAQAGLPPTTLSGQSSATKPTTFGTQVPYNQATSLGGINSLIETGDENMLLNPNFEAPTLSGWTCTSGTCTVESIVFSSGKQSAKIVPAANIFDISQQVNVPANIQKQGVMGLIYNFPATCTTASIQTFSNGTVQTTVPTTSLILDGAFHSIEIPTTFGATSAKIRAFSTATCTGNIYIDKAYISQGIGYQNLMQDYVYSGTVSATGVLSNTNKSFFSGCTVASGATTCNIIAGTLTVAPVCTAISFGNDVKYFTFTQTTSAVTWGVAGATNYPINYTCFKSGNDYLAASANVYSQASANVRVAGEILPIAGSVCPSGTLLANGSAISRTTYSELFGRIGITHGQGDGATTFNLPDYRGRFLRGVDGGAANDPDRASRTAMNTGGNTGDNVGSLQSDDNKAHVHRQMITTGGGSGYQQGSGATNGNQVYVNGYQVESSGGNESRPKNANVNYCILTNGASNIVGSFEKIEKCASVAECIDVVSAKFSSSGVISDLNLPGAMSLTSLTDTSLYTIAFSGFTSIPTCTVSSVDNAATNGTYARIDSISLSSIVIRTFYTSGALIKNPYPFNLSCQKTGVDSKPKTAKIASSIGVPTVPGITTEAIDTFSVSYGTTNATTVCSASPCSYLDQIGTAASSVTRSGTGSYSLNVTKTYSKLKCTAQLGSSTSYTNSTNNTLSCSSCNSISFTSGAAAVTLDTFGNLMCQGQY